MKRGRILNRDLNEAISSMGHYDLLIIADAAFPIPETCRRIDLALEKDVPDILTLLDLIGSDFIFERVVVAEEQKAYNNQLFQQIQARCGKGVKLETWPNEKILKELAPTAKVIVRSGAFSPWGSVCLFSGIDAPRWFDKEGLVVPEFYRERVEKN